MRYTTLGLAPRRVIEEEIPGVIAGVGGWHGETSAFPHRVAPQRRLYLFDTLERFPGQDRPPRAADERLRDTRVAAMSHWMASPNLILMPGYVPATQTTARLARCDRVRLGLRELATQAIGDRAIATSDLDDSSRIGELATVIARSSRLMDRAR